MKKYKNSIISVDKMKDYYSFWWSSHEPLKSTIYEMMFCITEGGLCYVSYV
jgi:hypothetical protein